MTDPRDSNAPSPALPADGIREQVVTYAYSLDGLSANPADPVARAAYFALIAPGETPRRAAEMATMSGCALTCRAILRHFIAHLTLEAPYRTGRAMADLVEIAYDVQAIRPPRNQTPMPGDMVIIGGGSDGGGSEHVWTALDEGGGAGIDGGQLDAQGFQKIVLKNHLLLDGTGRDGSRKVRYVLDVETIVRRFGR